MTFPFEDLETYLEAINQAINPDPSRPAELRAKDASTALGYLAGLTEQMSLVRDIAVADMYHQEFCPYAEIARRLVLSPARVGQIVSRHRRYRRDLLAEIEEIRDASD